jgi:hypothetical protein
VRQRAVAITACAALLGGCADRGVVSGPSSSPTASTWAAVVVAMVLATVVLAALIALPAMRPGGAKVAAWVLALQAGGVAVGGAIVIGAAVRSEQLVDRPPDAEQAASLLRLTALDGNAGFFTLVALLVAVVGGLLVAVLAIAARFAADIDTVERVLASALLGLEVLASVTCGVLVALGFRHTGFVLPALALPALVVAAWSAWPKAPSPAPSSSTRH